MHLKQPMNLKTQPQIQQITNNSIQQQPTSPSQPQYPPSLKHTQYDHPTNPETIPMNISTPLYNKIDTYVLDPLFDDIFLR